MTVQKLESIKNNLYDKLSLKEEYNTSVKQLIDEYPQKGKGIFDGFTSSRYEVFLFSSDVVTKAESDSN